MTKIEKLFNGDKRCENILEHIMDLLHKEADGMPIPAILGILELTKVEILKELDDDR